ncbi:tail fiber assembly protein [[Enterobacter] lignolyticus]|uniref:Tail assembly chaperone gp38 n=1 Tax=Enterobacter lignolyticus (strain SCF1) TaxID=701347 RepID=E3G2V8_ENTLS|nr:tail fiber assembly protein [[Enterobacter] lignolyticus]ADO48139.1 tail assembly chaperone gp38 [[Enterobacter] lignolyticus SCF1]
MKTIYVWTGDFRSYGDSADLWGGSTIPVQVTDDFVGGAKTYYPETNIWVDDPPYVMTHEDHVLAAEVRRQQLITAANNTMDDWILDLQLGMISDADRSQLIIWRQYAKDLKALNLDSAPDINWPLVPEQ